METKLVLISVTGKSDIVSVLFSSNKQRNEYLSTVVEVFPRGTFYIREKQLIIRSMFNPILDILEHIGDYFRKFTKIFMQDNKIYRIPASL
jgi:hypothetical protein